MSWTKTGVTDLNGRSITTAESKRTWFGLYEVHYPGCTCSHCTHTFKSNRMGHFAPPHKAWNSWWTIHWKIGNVHHYLRYHSIFYRWRRP